jgi:hypothetical protein
VPEGENHGLTNSQLASVLQEALTWALDHSLKSVITNGIADTDHSQHNISNRSSDDARARFLIDLMSAYEREFDVTIGLISQNDIFVRNLM